MLKPLIVKELENLVQFRGYLHKNKNLNLEIDIHNLTLAVLHYCVWH